jgi:hypothetical protein
MTDTVEGVCEKCGGGVSIDEEGALKCDGCGVSTGACTCGGRTGTISAPPDRENLT